jgi:hypothetical protein
VSKRRDLVLNSRIYAERRVGQLRKAAGGATPALAETCGTKTGIKKEELHVEGQEGAGGVMGKYSGASGLHTVEYPRNNPVYNVSQLTHVKF